MGWFTKETKSLYISRPSEFAKELIYLHPDTTITRGANFTVRSDECALFFREGKFIGKIGPGSHKLDTANFPFLGHLLVNTLTGGNHFITELFFVALSEVIINLPETNIGQYQDLNSRNVVNIETSGAYTLRVKDPEKLLIEIGGQSSYSSDTIVNILNGRLINGLRKSVGKRSTAIPILTIVSNSDSEAISTELINFAKLEFDEMGISISRILNLEFRLDDESLQILRAFGKQEADLTIQSRGAQIASQAGYAEYNLVQGQRAALEGMGKGLAQGKTMMFMGNSLGANLTKVPNNYNIQNAQAVGLRSPGSPILSQPRQYFIISDQKENGPYTARQIVLKAISEHKELNDIQIRADGDTADMTITANMESAIVAEFKRRTG